MTPKEKNAPKAHVSEAKKKRVKELKQLIQDNKTILVASIKNIPNSQFQEIVKKLRGKVEVKVPKKSLIFRAIDSADGEELKKVKQNITESMAILFSKLDAFELAGELIKSKRAAKAKPGQIAPEDIEIPEGPTELVPGPAISELGALGIQIQIEKGKIHIKESKIIAKKGEEIKKNAAELMGKLGIKPFKIGFTPLCAFDTEKNILYKNIKIDEEATIEELKTSFVKSLAFAVEIGYINEDTITLMISKACAHEKTIENLLEKESREKKKEESKEESGDKEEKPEEKVEEPVKQNKEESKEEEEEEENTKQENKTQEEKK